MLTGRKTPTTTAPAIVSLGDGCILVAKAVLASPVGRWIMVACLGVTGAMVLLPAAAVVLYIAGTIKSYIAISAVAVGPIAASLCLLTVLSMRASPSYQAGLKTARPGTIR